MQRSRLIGGQRRGRAVTPDGGNEVGTVRGHVLGNVGLVRDNIEYAIVGVILVPLTPVLVELYRTRRHGSDAPRASVDELV